MQPFTADPIDRLLTDAPGRAQGKQVYVDPNEAVRESCANPLLTIRPNA